MLRCAAFCFFFFKHLHSSQSRWRVVSWSCGWRKSSICPGSCVGRRGWSWSTASVRRSPLAPGWRGSEAGWSGTRGTRGTSGLSAQGGSGSDKARSEASRWIRTGWTWGRGCGFPRSMAAKRKRGDYYLLRHFFWDIVATLCAVPKLYQSIIRLWPFLTSPVSVLCYHRLSDPCSDDLAVVSLHFNLVSLFRLKLNDLLALVSLHHNWKYSSFGDGGYVIRHLMAMSIVWYQLKSFDFPDYFYMSHSQNTISIRYIF